jgi:GT2 family glycosyltransferase
MGRVNNFSVYYIHENKRAGLQIFKKTINRPWPSFRHLRVGRNKRTFGRGKLRPRDRRAPRRQGQQLCVSFAQGALMTIYSQLFKKVEMFGHVLYWSGSDAKIFLVQVRRFKKRKF